MKKNLLNSLSWLVSAVFFFFLATTFSMSAKALPVESLLGRWTAQEPIYGQNVQFFLSFQFDQDCTQMTVQCVYFNGDQLEARAAAATNYSANEIYIQENNQTVVNDGIHFCRATLQPAHWSAYFDGTGKMVLFMPTPYQSRLTLVREDI